jgi:hypothetical protein
MERGVGTSLAPPGKWPGDRQVRQCLPDPGTGAYGFTRLNFSVGLLCLVVVIRSLR